MTQKPKPKTKKAQMIQMLRRKFGADIATISAKLGWQPHTTRAALSGLRKAGVTVIREEASGSQPARYRIMAASPAAVARGSEDEVAVDAR